jgi:hypothetical protein
LFFDHTSLNRTFVRSVLHLHYSVVNGAHEVTLIIYIISIWYNIYNVFINERVIVDCSVIITYYVFYIIIMLGHRSCNSFCEVNRQTLSFLGREKKIKNQLATKKRRNARPPEDLISIWRRLSTPEYRLTYSSY